MTPVALSSKPSVHTPVAKRCSGPSVRNATRAVASFIVDAGLNGSLSFCAETTLPSRDSMSTPCTPYSGRAVSAAAGVGEGWGEGLGERSWANTFEPAPSKNTNVAINQLVLILFFTLIAAIGKSKFDAR